VPDVAPDLLGRIAARDWPGHVRELRNAAERIALGLEIADAEGAPDTDPTLAGRMAAHEKALISAALTAHSGSLKATYEALGLSRKGFTRRCRNTGSTGRITAPSKPVEGGGKRAFSVGDICRFSVPQFSAQRVGMGRKREHHATDLGRF
jgi:transcriptional regulator with AAA-type ATPase domain